MTAHPTLDQQIEAIAWAIVRIEQDGLHDDELAIMRPRLIQAAASLQILEMDAYARETLK